MNDDFGKIGVNEQISTLNFLSDFYNKHGTKCLTISFVAMSSYLVYKWIGKSDYNAPWPFNILQNSNEEGSSDSQANPLLDYDNDGNPIYRSRNIRRSDLNLRTSDLNAI